MSEKYILILDLCEGRKDIWIAGALGAGGFVLLQVVTMVAIIGIVVILRIKKNWKPQESSSFTSE